MELSLAVNASLVALSKYGKFFPFYLRRQLNTVTAIFCTEPFRIPFAGRVDVCCFDKTGTITAENLVLEGVVGVECVPGLWRSCGFPNFIFSGGSSRDRFRRRFQFSSALKRMSTISSLPGGKTLASVKGAPETIRGMLKDCPAWYDETYKWYTRRGSRVLALGAKDMDTLNMDKVRLGPVMRDGF